MMTWTFWIRDSLMLRLRFWKRCTDHKWSRPDHLAKECSHRVIVWRLRSGDIVSHWWKQLSHRMEWRAPGLRDSTWIQFPNNNSSSSNSHNNSSFINNNTTSYNNNISNKRSNSLMTKKWFGMMNRSLFRPFRGPVTTFTPATFRYRLIYDVTVILPSPAR